MLAVKILMSLILLFSGGMERVERLTDTFREATSVIVSVEDMKTEYEKGDDKYQKIIEALYLVTTNSHEMPAFGVSIDSKTREDIKSGTYIELIFDDLKSHEGMDYEALLIKVERDWYGFNLIRRVNGKYDGRCFYLSLDGSMDKLADAIDEVSKNS